VGDHNLEIIQQGIEGFDTICVNIFSQMI